LFVTSHILKITIEDVKIKSVKKHMIHIALKQNKYLTLKNKFFKLVFRILFKIIS
jgi:hypothetical protein